jgi:hypothetical protein
MVYQLFDMDGNESAAKELEVFSSEMNVFPEELMVKIKNNMLLQTVSIILFFILLTNIVKVFWKVC